MAQFSKSKNCTQAVRQARICILKLEFYHITRLEMKSRKICLQNEVWVYIIIYYSTFFFYLLKNLIQLMPNLKIEKERFFELMGERYTFDWLDDLGFEFGIEIEEDVERDKEGNIIKQHFKFDCMNNRPDLLSEASLVRAFKIYLGQIKTPTVTLSAPTTSLVIDPSVKQIRPFIAAAILRNISFNEKTYKAFIAAQQKLHDTFCRARKYASIGTHDLDSIKGPFRYVAKDPKQFEFIPLNQQKKVNGLGMMELLQNHKLKQYLHLIRDSPVYPLVLDSNNVVCSVPPIINGQHSKITINTKNVLVQVTALNRPKAYVCLNNIIWAFAEYCSTPFEVQPVEIINGQEKFLTPDISSKEFTVLHKNAETLIGAKLQSQQVINYLARTGLSATLVSQGVYKVLAPFWRGDILHECDILQDIAICYGYSKITPVLPPSATIGSRLRVNKFTDFLRQEMAQSQFNEVLNFALCSKAEETTYILNEDESNLISISNAKTKEFQTGRTSLLPGLIKTVVENKSNPLPYKLFQAGNCIIADSSTDTGSRNLNKIAALITDEVQEGNKKGSIFSIVHGALDILLKKSNLQFEKDYKLVPSNSPFYFPGQQFVIEVHGKKLGTLGVVHPKVLVNFGWNHPTAVWEVDITLLEQVYTESFK